MKKKKFLKAYLVILIHVIIGLVILVTTEKLQLPLWINASVLALILFLAINLIGTSIFKLKKELLEFWSFKKSPYLIVGIIGGAAIGLTPEIVTILIGKAEFTGQINVDFSISVILTTFVIVGWEELWFRGLFLNYCNRFLSPINLSLTIGALFMLVHALNPEMNLLVSGPGLFFAGALLTILYFTYRTIWLPLGLHFGNNFFGSAIEVQNADDVFLGSDGYLGTIVLALLYLVFVIKLKKTNTNKALI
ncbi:MAG: CPBP family intramembrane metalloprotease [Flavobacteriales bacterium]|nr:CPBP family intramembrane metalloprotease [Flavobacteriales bacterium]